MKYDFSKAPSRRGSGSLKWDEPSDPAVLPMWVADMDFPAAPCIQQALQKRVDHGVFGYELVPESYFSAVREWFARRHGLNVECQWMLYTSGVVPATSCAIKALCMEGENVLVQTPVYNCFFSSICNQGCQIVENELVRDGGSYRIDFDDFERKCADPKTTAFLLCNPHNPAGRVWTPRELAKMNDICLRHGVKVISDEIHCEIVMPGYSYTPFAAVSRECLDNSVTLSSPSKAFNTAGLQIANVFCPNAEWRRRIDRAINNFEVCDVNPFGPPALEAAYSDEGAEWLAQLNEYIYGNYECLREFIAREMPALEVLRLEATYLAWIDIRRLGISTSEAWSRLLRKGKLMVSKGTDYGAKAGEGYLRLNLACPRATLQEGLRRMKLALG